MISKSLQKIFSFIMLLAFGIYLAHLFNINKLFYYIHERFFNTIILAYSFALFVGISFFVLSFIYVLFISKKRNQYIQDFKAIIKKALDVKIVAIIFLFLLAIVTSPFVLLFAIFIVIAPIKNSHFDKILRRLSIGNILIVVIACLGLFIPPEVLSSDIAQQRETSYSTFTTTTSKPNAINNFNTDTTNYNIGDWLNSLNYNPDLSNYKDKEVALIGFVYSPTSQHLPADEFLIARFMVSCCAVDATPVGLKVKYDDKNQFAENDWIKLHGKFNIENNQLVIIPDQVEKTTIPDNPYLYL